MKQKIYSHMYPYAPLNLKLFLMLSSLSHHPPTIHNNFVFSFYHSFLFGLGGKTLWSLPLIPLSLFYSLLHFVFLVGFLMLLQLFMVQFLVYNMFFIWYSFLRNMWVLVSNSWISKKHSNFNVHHYCASVGHWWWSLWFWNNLFRILCKFLCF